MKLGLALVGKTVTPENLRFARQCGVTDIVVHFTDYERDKDRLPPRFQGAYGFTGGTPVWTYNELCALKAMINAEGLELAALENFNPGFWHDVLLDGPRKQAQMDGLKQLIRDMGRAGIPIMGYAFNLMNVWGHVQVPLARGQAVTGAYLNPEQTPIPAGMVWNMVYDPEAPADALQPPVTREALWGRLEYFLRELLPVAEEAGVVLAAHPDDPPMPTLRGVPRLIHHPDHYQTLFDLAPSANNQAEFCVGTIAEMAGGDTYAAVDAYSRQGKIAYVHLRNVRGKVPNYIEVFIDEGDTDVLRVLRLLHRNGYDGIITPDHTPMMACAAPWHAGMAFALGYIRAALTLIEQEPREPAQP
jgi:mannonate dehydratase